MQQYLRFRLPRLADEKDDLLLLGLAFLVVPLTWGFALNWNFSDALCGHDGISQYLLVARDYLSAGSRWKEAMYRPDLLGGIKIEEVGSLYGVFQWIGQLPLSAVAILNFTILLIQMLMGFLGARTAENLAI